MNNMQRLWNKIKKTDNCWEWQACISGGGYGVFNIDGKNKPAHRVVYELLVGEIPEGLQLDHLCRNRACVNPKHLEPVTARENTLRGETIPAQLIKRTHCKNGHEYTPGNTANQYGWRRCKECNRTAAKVAYYKNLSAT